MFKICDGVFDEESGKYIPNTLTQKYECCIDSCLPSHKYCVSQCKEKVHTLYSKELNEGKMSISEALTRCEQLCTDSHSICTHTCNLLSPKFEYGNIYHKCAVDNGCVVGQNLQPSSKCISDNKDKIMNCCTTQFEKNGNSKDGKEYCTFQQERGNLRDTDNIKDNIELMNNYQDKSDKTWLLIIIAIICAIIVTPLLIKNLIVGIVAIGLVLVIIYTASK